MSTNGAKKELTLDAVFHALADGTRRRIVAGLSRGPASVTELAAPFSISLPAVSKHIGVLERAGLVRRERRGRFLHCHLLPTALDDASAFIEQYRAFWQLTLDQLVEYVEQSPPVSAPPRKRIKRQS